MFISLIFPCRNEEQAIPELLPKILEAKKYILQKRNVMDLEILIVDDGSEDQSLQLLKQYEKDIRLLSTTTNQGYGSALKKGIRNAKGDWIAFCDLDNSCPPKELILLIDQAHEQSLPAVWGNRLHGKSQIQRIRRFGNRLYQLAFLLLSFRPAPDPCSGFRLFKKSAFIPQIYEFPEGLGLSLAFTAHCVRYKIPFSSVNISYKKRMGQSKLRIFKDGLSFFLILLKFLFFKKYNSKKEA